MGGIEIKNCEGKDNMLENLGQKNSEEIKGGKLQDFGEVRSREAVLVVKGTKACSFCSRRSWSDVRSVRWKKLNDKFLGEAGWRNKQVSRRKQGTRMRKRC